MVIGKYIPATGDTEEVVEKEFFGQGFIYKNDEAFRKNMDEICYIPEFSRLSCFNEETNEDVEYGSHTKYTRRDFINLCNDNEKLAEMLFDDVDWQHPESLLEEWSECGLGED